MKIRIGEGLIFFETIVDVKTADVIARANGHIYAERFVKANDGKTLEIDPLTYVVVKP